MFERFKRTAEIRAERESVGESLKQLAPEDPRYTVAVQNYETLVNLERGHGITVSGDALLKFTGNILVAGMLMFHEEIGHVIPAKFMRFLDN